MNENHVIAGFISGTVQTIIGHPFDTLKIWKQKKYTDVKNFRNLYRGLFFPLATSSSITSLQFTTAAIARKLFFTSKQGAGITKNPWQEFVTGAFSGLFVGVVTSPIDKLKISRQVMTTSNTRFGIFACLSREVPASAIYFASYAKARKENHSILLSGSIAGCTSWLCTYPFDVIKTNVQSGKIKNVRDGFREIFSGKLKPFSGLSFCLQRAFLVNGIGFYVYEYFI